MLTLMVIGTVLGGVALALNLAASLLLWRTSALTRGEKTGQSLLVWAIPFLGSIMVLKITGEIEPESAPMKSLTMPGPSGGGAGAGGHVEPGGTPGGDGGGGGDGGSGGGS